jgi:predicted Zn-dependent protease
VRAGQTYLAAGRLADAEKAFFRASTSGDRSAAGRGNLGLADVAMRNRHYSQAVSYAQRAAGMGADKKRAWRTVAQAKCALGDHAGVDAANQKLTAAGGTAFVCP